MDERFFDDLAKGLDDGTVSRVRALKLLGAAILGGALSSFLFPGIAEAHHRHHHKNPPPPICGSSEAGCKIGACTCPSGTTCVYTALSDSYGICCPAGQLCG
jgi:hypothetical protein